MVLDMVPDPDPTAAGEGQELKDAVAKALPVEPFAKRLANRQPRSCRVCRLRKVKVRSTAQISTRKQYDDKMIPGR